MRESIKKLFFWNKINETYYFVFYMRRVEMAEWEAPPLCIVKYLKINT